jgi:ribose 5-phosphate isomerase A
MDASTPSESNAVNDFKKAAANWAVAQLKEGMVVGLGSRSTASFAVSEIGRLVRAGLRIVGIPTSENTAEQARGFGIPLSTLSEHPQVDVTIDGADEVDLRALTLIKGGGGNLLREKIVAAASTRLVIVVDQSKLVNRLGGPIPVEVAQFGWKSTAMRLARLGSQPVPRHDSEGKMFITDGGNFIIDCAFGSIDLPAELQTRLDGTVGVVEHGLFIGLASQIVVGDASGVRVFDSQHTGDCPEAGARATPNT